MRRCEVCAAAVTNINPRCTTCSPVCTRAKKSGRTLKHQQKWEARKAGSFDTKCPVCMSDTWHCQCTRIKSENYEP